MAKPSLLHLLAPLLLRIPRGYVTTYGDLARAIGKPGAARAVGQALKWNPDLKNCPCFLVVRSDGSIGGYAKGPREKVRRLQAWEVGITQWKVQDFARKRWR